MLGYIRVHRGYVGVMVVYKGYVWVFDPSDFCHFPSPRIGSGGGAMSLPRRWETYVRNPCSEPPSPNSQVQILIKVVTEILLPQESLEGVAAKTVCNAGAICSLISSYRVHCPEASTGILTASTV